MHCNDRDRALYVSSSLPFGGDTVDLPTLKGSVYATTQLLVQHAAFTLSDKIFTYSPESFDLDLALKRWEEQGECNGFKFTPGINPMQIRGGAGSIALGYMFSPDYDLTKRHVPQSLVACSSALHPLRPSLDQLSLLHDATNPVIAHIAAVDYSPSSPGALVADYVTPQAVADDLEFSLISSSSVYEAQHMSLLATLLANHNPIMHVYDGVHIARDTTKVLDVLNQDELFDAYLRLLSTAERKHQKQIDRARRTSSLLQAFNQEMGTDYRFFEHYGHREPESVLIVFGSVESSLGAQLVTALADKGEQIGIINVRIYRPFSEEALLETLPKSVQKIGVLGQVESSMEVTDLAVHSKMYQDVLAAVTFSVSHAAVSVVDLKYSREVSWSPAILLSTVRKLQAHGIAFQNLHTSIQEEPSIVLGSDVKQYTFWDLDDSALADTPTSLAHLLSETPTENVAIRSSHDNLICGGTKRTDIRHSPRSIEAPYSITSADVVFVGHDSLLAEINVLDSLREMGTVVLKLPGGKKKSLEDLEKALPAAFRQQLFKKQAYLFLFDPEVSPKTAESTSLESLLLQIGLLRLTREDYVEFARKLDLHYRQEMITSVLEEHEVVLSQLALSESTQLSDSYPGSRRLPTDIFTNSFNRFEKDEAEHSTHLKTTHLKTWISAAQALAFEEAFGTSSRLRPDAGVPTKTVYVKEHRRLTPLDYDRNVFHIEFDLADSGLEYKIGEALGIHAENDKHEVEEFIKWYGLDADDVVEVPSRGNPQMLEERTVYQALTQNLDLFGRPPKRFYESLAAFANDENERKELLALCGSEGIVEFKRRAEVDTVTFADILLEYPSAHPSFHDIVRIVNPMKRREYSIASSQKATPNTVSLLIVTVLWTDPKGRDRFGQATKYLNNLAVGSPVTVSIKPSVMKLPQKTTSPLVMAGLGTGLAPFRAFVQERAWQKQHGQEIGSVLLYMGSRHQREEYLYGEEWEAYQDAGVITLLGRAFSRDQPQKIYIQDRMRQTMDDIRKAYLHEDGSFYLCGPTWPVPEVSQVLQEAIEVDAKQRQVQKVNSRREIEKLKDESRFVLEVY